MTQQNDLQQLLYSRFLGIRLMVGATIPVTLLNLFLLIKGIKYEDYVFVPMTTVAIGGALGAISFHVLDYMRTRGSWNKAVVYTAGVIMYALAVWVSLVGGLSVIGLWD
ncbi:MAG TPA: hypothetical protein VEB42_04610 [Chitinophagaceae bacterium]|nr:hypothetical protein [Chitinophagaceae bacterium]